MALIETKEEKLERVLTRVRDQLESLATDVDCSCAPQTPEQWRRCLRVIAAGGEWEVDGTWR